LTRQDIDFAAGNMRWYPGQHGM